MTSSSSRLEQTEAEYEMAIHIATAFSHVKEARKWSGGDPSTDGRLNDAEHALKRVWQDISDVNRELVDMSALYYAKELRDG
jgi:hypothetical protein